MSKIICDVCGTSFPETANQCPICGCVRTGEVKTVAGDTNTEEVKTGSTYTYVKGGRFSKSNVRKRNRENQIPVSEKGSNRAVNEKKEDKKDRGLTIAVIALVLAVIAVVLYIMIRVFGGGLFDFNADKQTTAPSVSTNIPCTGLTIIGPTRIELRENYQLSVTVQPADTTDEIDFVSNDESIVKVTKISNETKDCVITAVGAGETTITVICGSIEVECQVTCNKEEETGPSDSTDPSDPTEPVDPIEPTDPTEPVDPTEPTDPIDPTEPVDPTDPSDPTEKFSLEPDDFSLFYVGDSWDIYEGSDPEKIIWTSDDTSVATIENGVVVAVGPGYTKVHGEYNGVKLSCIVRCKFEKSDTDNENIEKPYKLSTEDRKNDVSLRVNESFELFLLDKDNKPINVTWVTSDSSLSISGNVITRTAANTPGRYSVVSTEYEGVKYSCIVRTR